MEPDIRHIGVGGWTFIIHNRYFYLDRKGISLYQNGHGSLQSWLSRPLLSSLAGYVMVSVWKIDDTITVQLAAVEMYKADRCLPWQWQFFPKLQPWQRCLMVVGTVTPVCWAASQPASSPTPLLLRGLAGNPILQVPAQQVLDVSRDKPLLLHRNMRSAHTDVAVNLASWKKMRGSPAWLWQFPAAVPVGYWGLVAPPRGERELLLPGCAGLLEVSPGCLQTVWLKTPAGLELLFLL